MSIVLRIPYWYLLQSATRGLIGVVPNQMAATYNASSCQVSMSNVKTRPLMFPIRVNLRPFVVRESSRKDKILIGRSTKQQEEPDLC